MNYNLRIGRELYAVEASVLDEKRSTVLKTGDGDEKVTLSAVLPDRLHVEMQGRAINLFVAEAEGGTWVWVEGRARFVEDAEAVGRRRTGGPQDTPGAVTPPTPASVSRVMVEVGQEVEKGQALVVVSAMKMELTLSAPYSGTVTAVSALPGAQVMPGDILVEIEPKLEEECHE